MGREGVCSLQMCADASDGIIPDRVGFHCFCPQARGCKQENEKGVENAEWIHLFTLKERILVQRYE